MVLFFCLHVPGHIFRRIEDTLQNGLVQARLTDNLAEVGPPRKVRIPWVGDRLQLPLRIALLEPQVVDNLQTPFLGGGTFRAVAMGRHQVGILFSESLGTLCTRGSNQILQVDSRFTHVVGETDFEAFEPRDPCAGDRVMKHPSVGGGPRIVSHQMVQPGEVSDVLVESGRDAVRDSFSVATDQDIRFRNV